MIALLQGFRDRTFVSVRLHRNYRLFLMGAGVHSVGKWMQNAALSWFVFDLTSSAAAVGFLFFCRLAPFTLLSLVAGATVDRVDNRRLLLVAQSASMLVAIALAVLAFSGGTQVAAVYALAALGGTAMVFEQPLRHSLTYQMVGRAELPNAVALNSSVLHTAQVVGPAIAGLTIAAVGVAWCFTVNAVGFSASLGALLAIRREELVKVERSAKTTVLRGIREGLAHVRGNRRVRTILITTAAISSLGFYALVLIPVLAVETLGAGPRAYGLLSACFGAGAVVGALTAAGVGRASMRLLFAGSGGLGIALLALAPQRHVVLAGLLLLLAGACFTVWAASANTNVQLAAPDHLRGRVLSVFLLVMQGMGPIGALVMGWLAEVGGTTLAFTVSGAVCLGVTAVAVAVTRPAS